MAWAETTPEKVLDSLDGDVTVDEVLSKDVVLVDDWPEGTSKGSIKSKATPEGLVFAAQAGNKVALKVSAPDPVGPALTVIKSILTSVYTRNQAIWGLEQDLAWRWYRHVDKRDKVPVISKNDRLFASLNTPTFTEAGSAQEQYNKWYSHAQQFYPIPMGYKLSKFDGGDWNPTGTYNISDYEEYAKWYNYFEDVQEAPEHEELTSEIFVPYNNYNANLRIYESENSNNYTTKSASSLSGVYLKINNSILQYLQNFLDNGYNLYFDVDRPNDPQGSCYVISSNAIRDKNNSNQYAGFTTTDGEPFKYRYISFNRRWYYYEDGNVKVNATSYIDNGLITATSLSAAANSFAMGTPIYGIGTEDEPDNTPVYYEPPAETIRPVAPIVSPVEPTYITYSPMDSTTTTVDLQPILEAIRNLDRNIQTGFNNVITAIETCCENMRTFLNAWLTDFFNWYELILDELQKQTKWLESIYYSKANDVIVDPTNPDDNNGDIQITWENNLSQLEKKFPLSIPWDLYGCLALLDAPPQAPVFELPVVMTEYTVEVDLSDFEPVAAISRKLSVLLFVVGLLMNTKKLISITIGEGMPD